MPRAVAIRRGCGTRHAGAAYLECGLSSAGLALENFLFDPAITDIDPAWLTPHRTPFTFEDPRTNTIHVVFWVGEEYYPDVWDFIHETRVAGASRKLPPQFDFEQLSDKSQMFFVHPRAHVRATAVEEAGLSCPMRSMGGSHHEKVENGLTLPHREHCLGFARYLWARQVSGYVNDAPNMDATQGLVPLDGGDHLVCGYLRKLPCGSSYSRSAVIRPNPAMGDFGVRNIDAMLEPAPGLFLRLPVTGIALVNREDGTFPEATEQRARRAQGVDVFHTEA